MNEYRITYSTADGEAEYSIIERSEAAAQKAFKAEHKGAEVSGIELTDTDAVATKRQQLETLEKIKAMVAELGPQSYLKTAFAGVFEDAETNIENDFGFSMKARYESAERKLREMGSDFVSAKADADHMREELDAARKQIAALQRQQLPEQLRQDLQAMAAEECEVSRVRMAKAAHMMAVCADNPGCVGFQKSVAEYRQEEKRAELMEQRAAALEALAPKSE